VWEEEVKKLEREWEEKGWGDRLRAILEEKKSIEEKVEKLKKELESMGTGQRDIRTIEGEIARLKRELQIVQGGGAVLIPGDTKPSSDLSIPEKFFSLREKGVLLSRKDPKLFYPSFDGAFFKFLQVVYPNRFRKFRFSERTPLFQVESGEEVPLSKFPLRFQEVIYVLGGMAVLFLSSETRSFPLVWDEPLPYHDDEILSLLGQLLKKLTSRFQVILFTGRKYLGAPFGNPLELSPF
jgi:hypothetical protein